MIILWITPILLIGCFITGVFYIKNFGFNQKPINYSLNYYGGQIKATYDCHTGQNYNKNIFNPKCFIGDISSKNTNTLIFGDSHAMADQGMISVWLKNNKQKGYIYTKSLTEQPKYYKYIMYNHHFINTLQYYINKFHPKTVIFGGDWDCNTYKKNNSYNTIDKSVRYLIKNGITPIIMQDVPKLGYLKPTCGLSKFEQLIGISCKINQSHLNYFMYKLEKKYPQIVIINPTKVYCKNKKCLTSMDGTNLYFNYSHLSYAGSKLIGEIYLKRYGNPLNNID